VVGQEATCQSEKKNLYYNDARDLFKKSFESQGHLLLQVKEQDHRTQKKDALQVLHLASMAVGDGGLVEITALLSAGGAFDDFIEAVDKLPLHHAPVAFAMLSLQQ